MLLIDPIGRQNSVRACLKCSDKTLSNFSFKWKGWLKQNQHGESNSSIFRFPVRFDHRKKTHEQYIWITVQCSYSLCTALIPHVHIPLLLLLTESESCLFNRRFVSLLGEEHEVAKYESAVVISFCYALHFGGLERGRLFLWLQYCSKYLLRNIYESPGYNLILMTS